MKRDLVKILGFNVDTFAFVDAVNYACENSGQIVTINPEMIAYARSNPDFAEIVNNAELIVPDGIGVELGLKILGHNVRRIAGIDLGKELLVKFSSENKSVALVGAKPEVVDLAVKNLKSEIKNINIVYSHDGYFDNNEDVFNNLLEKSPDLVLVALGSPKQEYFIQELKKKLPRSTFIGLGGSFDVWAGAVERAPKFFQNMGLEWLYRTIKDPKRFKRIFPTLPLFVLDVFVEKFRRGNDVIKFRN